jgi:DNA-binding LacI/PurR family transcriptional regulator
METTSSPELSASYGRVSAEFLTYLRRKITTGQYPAGQYLPTLRELSESRGIARKTVLSVLRKLEDDGFILAEPRKGYRVQALASDPAQGCPLAYVAGLGSSPDQWKPMHQELLWALQSVATARNWTLMGVGTDGRNSQTILQQLMATRTSGLIVDAVEKDLMDAIWKTGMPTVAVDAWNDKMPIDLVAQDSYQGGLLAAEYLVQRNHKRVAWLGPTSWSTHSLARVAGTVAGFLKHNQLLGSDSIVECERDNSTEAARRLLRRKDRPTGIVSLYQEVATTLVTEARRMGLQLGKDIEIVGWMTEQQYQRDWLPLFRDEPVMPAVVWSPLRMAQLAMERLDSRRRNPQMSPVRMLVPVELREGRQTGDTA